MTNAIPFGRTALMCVLAAAYPLAQHAAAQTTEQSCTRLLVLADDAGDRIASEFSDVRAIALRNDANECNVYASRVEEAGGLVATDANASDTEAVTQTLEIEREATIQGEVQVTLPDPVANIEQEPADISVRRATPEVTVDQGQPSIVIRQAKPIITVRMAQPTITVKQPAPEIIITMPEPGVSVANAQPLVEVNIPEPGVINQRTHRKVLVVDGEIGFTGGVGIAAEWTGNAQGPEHGRDDHFRVTGPAVRYLDGAFAENWLNATGELLVEGVGDQDAHAPATEGMDTERLLVVSTSPRGDISPIALIYWTALSIAQDSVDISTPYFVPDRALLETLTATARRGVRVRLLLPCERYDKRILHWASTTHYTGLLDAGVELYLFEPTMTHSKMIIVDDRWSIVGSPNPDNRSFELNDEIVLVGDAPSWITQLRDAFEQDLTRSDRLRADERSLSQRTLAMLYHGLLVFREQL